jgi:hypothetical protein
LEARAIGSNKAEEVSDFNLEEENKRSSGSDNEKEELSS